MKKFLFSFCLCLVGFMSQAQESPVSWTFDAEQIEGSKYLIKFTAEIQKNWVLYSQHIEDGGPIPTGFFFTEAEDYLLVGSVEEKSKSYTEMDELFEMKITKFKEKALFEQIVEVKSKSVIIGGELEYMTCDGNRCLPPTVVEFNINIE